MKPVKGRGLVNFYPKVRKEIVSVGKMGSSCQKVKDRQGLEAKTRSWRGEIVEEVQIKVPNLLDSCGVDSHGIKGRIVVRTMFEGSGEEVRDRQGESLTNISVGLNRTYSLM